ncbi:MAG TPA: asparagine synthase (glutamine-hydrolyzing) [Candidatus Sulfotelmatobacter sp.]|nr:asparagine synthase (glutamine-hydrolyzing) [Candidatus Sulfotelmatobacter sp.]
MCGICGKLGFEPARAVSRALITDMLDTIRHRGPDDEGIYLGSQVGLGFVRLSIIDLVNGHQPLSNEDGTIWIVFNGEIYNYRELRAFLLSKGHTLKTQTDTEVIVHLYEELGAGCLERLRGMFAFALWDQNTRTLLLARDRVGIKPLYYSVSKNAIVFASEIKAILADPEVRRELAPEIIDRFLTFLYVPGEDTLLKDVHKLAPGHYLLIKDGKLEIRQYWDLKFLKPADALSLKDAENQLSNLLSESVELHMIADVPVGVLLSGGVDSTAVLSCAAQRTKKEISSYTVGFAGSGFIDERPYAKLAAETFGTRHHEMTISAADFAEFLPKYVWHMEEPVCEPPAIAMYYVSKLARKYVKVLLSGEGGDEAFAGYSNYRSIIWMERLKQVCAPLNNRLSRGLSQLNSWVRSERVAKYAPLVAATFPQYYYSRTSTPYRYSGNGIGELYSSDFVTQVDRELTIEPVRRLFSAVNDECILDQMLYIDTKTWLPDDLLIKADKMTMANSLELRVPLLDHRLLEFAAALPSNYKLKGFTLKYIWKKTLSDRIPEPILKRKKAGFPVPYESWLRNEFRQQIHDVLTDRKTLQRGYFQKSAIEKMIRANNESGAYSKEIFSLVTLELWHRMFMDIDQRVLN